MNSNKEDRKAPFTLFLWEGDHDLPTFDPDCLAVLMFCRVSKIPVETAVCNNPRLSPSGELPFLKHKNKSIGGVSRILNYLLLFGMNKKISLQNSDKARNTALYSYFVSSMLPAMTYACWYDKLGYQFMSQWLSQRLNFPLSFTVPRRMRKSKINRHLTSMQSLSPTPMSKECSSFGDNDDPSLTPSGFNISLTSEIHTSSYSPDMALRLASDCLKDIDTLLAEYKNGLFIFGEISTITDAVVFGYISFILSSPIFKDTLLIKAIKTLPHIQDFIIRINKNYFPNGEQSLTLDKTLDFDCENFEENEFLDDDDPDLDYQNSDDEGQGSRQSWFAGAEDEDSTFDKEDEKKELAKQNWRMFSSIAIAVGSMIFYALGTGMIRMKSRN